MTGGEGAAKPPLIHMQRLFGSKAKRGHADNIEVLMH